jgi:predicted  nucleic acid-binding Zn-ribbon protein
MISRQFDLGSARLMLSYLGRALKHYDERQFAKQKVKTELSRLKKISTKSMKKYVQNLERSISDAIKKEQRILKHQEKEDILHVDIKERIKELEERLAKYETLHEMRARKVRMLESAFTSEETSKADQIRLIRKSLERAERIYKKISKGKKHPKKALVETRKLLERIRAKISRIESE